MDEAEGMTCGQIAGHSVGLAAGQSIPRILILDNDETTGSYNLLFHLYDLFARASFGPRLDPALTMSVITRYARSAGVFRTGLTRLLHAVASMKRDGRIDTVIMYTNQLDIRQIRGARVWRTADGTEWSVPLMIQIMLVYVADCPDLVDHILTRPIDAESLLSPYPVKDLARAFKVAYPNRKVDLRATRFLDDLADEALMVDSSKSETDADARMKLVPYRRQMNPRLFRTVALTILEKHGLMLGEPDRRILDRQEAFWLHSNALTADTNIESSFEDVIPVLKQVYRKR